MSGAVDKTSEPDTYDFIIVGAGTASCLIASRLSQRLPQCQILLLEAGSHLPDDPRVYTPGLSASLQSDPKYDWQYVTLPEAHLNGRRIKHPRGKLVGGSSAINSHSVVFPGREWHDRLAQGLLDGERGREWTANGMQECYERWEAGTSQRVDVDQDARLPSEKVPTSRPEILDVLQQAWLKLFEDLGYPGNATGFRSDSVGGVSVNNAIDGSKGERSDAGRAFLGPAIKRGNVTLKTNVVVNDILFDEVQANGKLRARGVRFVQQDGQHQLALVTREVILGAGVFGSPQILERSGIGAREVLSSANIPVLYDLQGVGENLQDHLNCGLSIEVQDHVPTADQRARDPELQKAASLEYQRSRTGPLAHGAAYSFAFVPLTLLQDSIAEQELVSTVDSYVEKENSPGFKSQYSIIRDIVHSDKEATATLCMLRRQRNPDLDSLPSDVSLVVDGNYLTIVSMLAHPFSRGSSHITSSDPSRIEIKFNYLSHPLDVEIFARHVLQIERIFHQPAYSSIVKNDGRRLPRSFPSPISSLEDAKQMLPACSATNYHPCGTCAMMRQDLGGVVDETLRVYGTANVRVCDASVLPLIPRGNILTSVYAFAEKGSDLICRDAKID